MEVAAQATLVRLVPTWTNPNGCLAGHRVAPEPRAKTDGSRQKLSGPPTLKKADAEKQQNFAGKRFVT
jgi:hypothetical protein